MPLRSIMNSGLQPLTMAIPSRNTNPKDIKESSRTFFVTSRTSLGRALLQTDRIASLFIDVLRSYTSAGRFKVHDFVVMPNHFSSADQRQWHDDD